MNHIPDKPRSKAGVILRPLTRYAPIYLYMAAFFALCWFAHHVARLKMEMGNRRFAAIDEKTLRTTTLIDWVASHAWLTVAYALLAVASVAFLQIRGRPRWTWLITAAVYAAPWVLYGSACMYIAGKFLLFQSAAANG